MRRVKTYKYSTSICVDDLELHGVQLEPVKVARCPKQAAGWLTGQSRQPTTLARFEVTYPGNIMARGKGKGARKALKAVSTPVTMRKRGAIRELSLAGVANCIIDKALEVGHRCVQGG